MTTGRKKISEQDIIGAQGIALIQTRVLEMGYLFHETKLDAGIDGYIEIRDRASGEVTNCITQVQSKATTGKFPGESETGFHYICDERDLDYWLNGNAPVILVRSRPRNDEAYWVDIKTYFKKHPERRQDRKVVFDKKINAFDESCADQIANVALPITSGLYLGAPPRAEVLYTDILPAHFPDKMYVAATHLTKKPEVAAAVGADSQEMKWEFILHDKSIISFHNLRERRWKEACDQGTVEQLDTAEFGLSKDLSKQRNFTELLNCCLASQLQKAGLRYSKGRNVFYAKASSDLTEVKYKYKSREKETERAFFKPYFSKKDPTKISYCRHVGVQLSFLRFSDQWFLQIDPTQYYTFDGSRPSYMADELLRYHNSKQTNYSLHGQVMTWEAFLCDPSISTGDSCFLSFERAPRLEIDRGFSDKSWLADEEADLVSSGEDEPSGNPDDYAVQNGAEADSNES